MPSSVGLTGSYWPDGHHAHASSATSPAAPAITKPRRGVLPALQPQAFLPDEVTRRCMISTMPATGSARANSRKIDVATPSASWPPIPEIRLEPLV